MRSRSPRFLAMLLATTVVTGASVLLPAAASAAGGTLIVDRTDDEPTATACVAATPDDCSLRGALINSNADANAQVEDVQVPAGTYTLTQVGSGEAAGSLNIFYSANITGAGSGTTIIDGNGLDNILEIANTVGPASDRVATLSGLTLRNGDSCSEPSDSGGNQAGGALLVAAQVTATDLVLEDNNSCSAGGAVSVLSPLATLSLDNSVVHNNAAVTDGGGIMTQSTTTLHVTDSTISGNTAAGTAGGGGLNLLGNISIDGTTISGNTSKGSGGGFRAGNNAEAAAIDVTNSTISGNTSTYWTSGTPQYFPGVGGGISMNRTTLTLLHTTITNNTSQNHASTGGHGVGGALEMYNSTLTMDNSILAGNHADTECTIDGAAGGANNIAGLGCPGAGDVDPMLGPLADNGGPTMTHELVDGSPAIGTANPDKCAPADQRSAPRPVGEGCDIGAFEFGGVVPPPAPDEIASTVSIRYRRIRHAFKGHVASDDVGCYSGRKVTLKRKVSGPDLSVKSALTNGKGNYKIAKRRVTGKTWYVVARRKPVGDTVLCTKERSLDLSIPHA